MLSFGPDISFLIPSRRPHRLRQFITSLGEAINEVEIAVYIDLDDTQDWAWLSALPWSLVVRGVSPKCLGVAYNKLWRMTDCSVLGYLADDLLLELDGNWAREMCRLFAEGATLVYSCNEPQPFHGFVRRSDCGLLGYMMPEYFEHGYLDYWLAEVHVQGGRLVRHPGIKVRHEHWHSNAALFDEVYARRSAKDHAGLTPDLRDKIQFDRLAHCRQDEAKALARKERIIADAFRDWTSPFGPTAYHPFCRTFVEHPPTGYRFVCFPVADLPTIEWCRETAERPGTWGDKEALREYILNFLARCSGLGVSADFVWSYFVARQFPNQFVSSPYRLHYTNTIPSVISSAPWFCEIEDWVTLFRPFHDNGRPDAVPDEILRVVAVHLGLPNCRGIITHVRQTVVSLCALFPELHHKFHYVRPAMPYLGHARAPTDHFTFLFTGGSGHSASQFAKRGGIYAVAAYRRLRQLEPSLPLKLKIVYERSGLAGLPQEIQSLLDDPTIEVIDRFMTADELQQQRLESDIFLIPAYRLHVTSTMEALLAGLPVISSDGWGFDECVGEAGFRVSQEPYRKSWVDGVGLFREDYTSELLKQPEEPIVSRLVEAMTWFVERRLELPQLRETIAADARSKFSIDSRNNELGTLLDSW